MADEPGFLSRWSRRKVEVRQGVPVPDELPPAAPQAEVPPPPSPTAAHVEGPVQAPDTTPAPAADPIPTLADVARLTRDSDYTRFVTPGVEPDVRNAALKKLFGDPHFNLMDGLDTYIDDYGKPDPLPEGMLRQMAQARFLGLFTDEDDEAPEASLPVAADPGTPPSPEAPAHEDTDLRLQPHDAAGRPGPEPGAGQDGGSEH
jgi:hypothetical protein